VQGRTVSADRPRCSCGTGRRGTGGPAGCHGAAELRPRRRLLPVSTVPTMFAPSSEVCRELVTRLSGLGSSSSTEVLGGREFVETAPRSPVAQVPATGSSTVTSRGRGRDRRPAGPSPGGERARGGRRRCRPALVDVPRCRPNPWRGAAHRQHAARRALAARAAVASRHLRPTVPKLLPALAAGPGTPARAEVARGPRRSDAAVRNRPIGRPPGRRAQNAWSAAMRIS
jgi:hypothetical protein